MSEHKANNVYKILLVGHKNVGKRSIYNTFLDASNIEKSHQSIVTLNKNMNALLDVTYESNVHNVNLKKMSGILVVYSVTDLSSFKRAEMILKSITDKALKYNIKIVLVSNKIDVSHNMRKVRTEMATELAREYDVDHVEVSAKNRTNIKYIFNKIARLIYIGSDGRSRGSSMISIDLSEDRNEKPNMMPSICQIICACCTSLCCKKHVNPLEPQTYSREDMLKDSDYWLL
jgi:small GTP-binding protein